MTEITNPLESFPGQIEDDGTTVEDACRHCGTPITLPAWLMRFPEPIGGLGTTSCVPCIEKYESEKWKKQMEDRWLNLVPRRYRNTDRNSDLFPKDKWNQMRTRKADQSLMLYGLPDTGKTRLMIEWVKLIVWKKRLSFDFLMSEDIDGYFDDNTAEAMLKRFGHTGVLGARNLLDDICNSPRSVKWVKRLLAMRKRDNLITIATSHVKSGPFCNIGKDYYQDDRTRIHNIVSEWQREDWGNWTSRKEGGMTVEDFNF